MYSQKPDDIPTESVISVQEIWITVFKHFPAQKFQQKMETLVILPYYFHLHNFRLSLQEVAV